MANPLFSILMGLAQPQAQPQVQAPVSPVQNARDALMAALSQQSELPTPTTPAPVDRRGLGIAQAILQGAFEGFTGRPTGPTAIQRREALNRQEAARQDQFNLAQFRQDESRRREQLGLARDDLSQAREDERSARQRQERLADTESERDFQLEFLNKQFVNQKDLAEFNKTAADSRARIRNEIEQGKIDLAKLQQIDERLRPVRQGLLAQAADIRSGGDTARMSPAEVKRQAMEIAISEIPFGTPESEVAAMMNEYERFFEATVGQAFRDIESGGRAGGAGGGNLFGALASIPATAFAALQAPPTQLPGKLGTASLGARTLLESIIGADLTGSGGSQSR